MVRKRKSAILGRSKRANAARRKPSQETIKIWLDSDVVEHFRSSGPGWQNRINEALKKAKVG